MLRPLNRPLHIVLVDHPGAQRFLFSARAHRSLYEGQFTEGSHLVFGSETHGLAPSILEAQSGELLTIPMLPQRRSLNLSTAVERYRLRRCGSMGIVSSSPDCASRIEGASPCVSDPNTRWLPSVNWPS